MDAERSVKDAQIARGGWQPIETAPKDREIIGCHVSRWSEDRVTVYGPWTIQWWDGEWRSSWDGSQVLDYMSDFGSDYKGPDAEPTHWQPLPVPPTSESQP